MVQKRFPEKTNFVPHAVPTELYKPVSPLQARTLKRQLIGEERVNNFTGLWVNRNAKRKRPSDVLWSWKIFLDMLEESEGHRNATLIMHTDPLDQEGPNLYQVTDHFGISNNVFFSTERIEFEQMNLLYNVVDFTLNIAYAEGFGLPTLEAMQAGTPAIAAKTGGLTRQVVDHRDGSETGIPLEIDNITLVGSQHVPYINEDYASVENTAKGIMRLYKMSHEEREALSEKAREYALSEFSLENTINSWYETMGDLTKNWKYSPWECKTF